MNTIINRRECLRVGVGLAALMPIAGFADTDNFTRTLTEPTARTLVAVVATVTPMRNYNDTYYREVVRTYDRIASGKPGVGDILEAGSQALNDLAGGDFAAASTVDRAAALGSVNTPGFVFFVTNPALGVYSLPLVWRDIGYEGPSFDQGGYLYRGFDDIGWLADAGGIVQ